MYFILWITFFIQWFILIFGYFIFSFVHWKKKKKCATDLTKQTQTMAGLTAVQKLDTVVISLLFLKTCTTVYATNTAFTLSCLSLQRRIRTPPSNVSEA